MELLNKIISQCHRRLSVVEMTFGCLVEEIILKEELKFAATVCGELCLMVATGTTTMQLLCADIFLEALASKVSKKEYCMWRKLL